MDVLATAASAPSTPVGKAGTPEPVAGAFASHLTDGACANSDLSSRASVQMPKIAPEAPVLTGAQGASSDGGSSPAPASPVTGESEVTESLSGLCLLGPQVARGERGVVAKAGDGGVMGPYDQASGSQCAMTGEVLPEVLARVDEGPEPGGEAMVAAWLTLNVVTPVTATDDAQVPVARVGSDGGSGVQPAASIAPAGGTGGSPEESVAVRRVPDDAKRSIAALAVSQDRGIPEQAVAAASVGMTHDIDALSGTSATVTRDGVALAGTPVTVVRDGGVRTEIQFNTVPGEDVAGDGHGLDLGAPRPSVGLSIAHGRDGLDDASQAVSPVRVSQELMAGPVVLGAETATNGRESVRPAGLAAAWVTKGDTGEHVAPATQNAAEMMPSAVSVVPGDGHAGGQGAGFGATGDGTASGMVDDWWPNAVTRLGPQAIAAVNGDLIVPGEQRLAETAPAGEETRVSEMVSGLEQPLVAIVDGQPAGVGASARLNDAPQLQRVLPQVLDAMTQFRGGAVRSLRVALNPEELGPLEVQVVSRGGMVQARLTAESREVKGLLDSQVVLLQRHLHELGVKVDRVEVIWQGADPTHQGFGDTLAQGQFGGEQSRSRDDGSLGMSAGVTTSETGEGAAPVAEPSGAIDYRA